MARRETQLAGKFFPEEGAALAGAVKTLAQTAAPLATLFPATPRAVIAPHAGFAFSGALSAAAWATTAQAAPARIVILSPSHHVAFDGLAVPTGHDVVSLPGKRVQIDRAACQALIRAGHAHGRDVVFEAEHGIDVQLPFARHYHPKVPVLPMVIGHASAGQVAAAIDRLMRIKGETLFVLSSDLSHFLPRAQAARIDGQTAGLIETGQGGRLTPAHACGARAISGWFASATGAACRVMRLGQGNSLRGGGDPGGVVGYGAWALFDEAADVLPQRLRQELLRVARQALASQMTRGASPRLDLSSFATPQRSVMASFVSLESGGFLRGCMGSMAPHRPLVSDVMANAVLAGFGDTRFNPLTAPELERIEIGVSLLTRPRALEVDSEAAACAALVPGKTGLILSEGDRRALFLPSVWQKTGGARNFLRALKQKAGIAADHWSGDIRLQVFRTESFGETQHADRAIA